MKQAFLYDLIDLEKRLSDNSTDVTDLPKYFLMGYLAERMNLITLLELGVSEGRSLFLLSKMIERMNGLAMGVDPYPENEDFPVLLADVLETKRILELETNVRILRSSAEDAYPQIRKQFESVGMLYFSESYDSASIKRDAAHYIPLVQEGGIIAFDNVNSKRVRSVYDKYSAVLPVLYETESFAILYKPRYGTVLPGDIESPKVADSEEPLKLFHERNAAHYKRCLPYIYQNTVAVLERKISGRRPSVFIAIPTYNQGKYIKQCVESALYQYGDFDMTVMAINDASTDKTLNVLLKLQEKYPQLKIQNNKSNLGMVRNYTQMLEIFEASGCDYLTILEGDDYFFSGQRTASHVEFLESNPDCCSVFNDFLILYNETGAFEWMHRKLESKGNVFDLASDPLVGNFSANTFCRHAIQHLPKKDMESIKYSDWLTGVMVLETGDLGHIKEPLSVYRKCDSGLWSKLTEEKQYAWLYDILTKFNQFTNDFYSENNAGLLNMSRERAKC